MKKSLIISIRAGGVRHRRNTRYADDAHHPKTEAQKNYAAKGEVIAVDKAAGKVKLKHEAIPEREWPTMTMFCGCRQDTTGCRESWRSGRIRVRESHRRRTADYTNQASEVRNPDASSHYCRPVSL
jgi:Cu/Ag efflux protein CusF